MTNFVHFTDLPKSVLGLLSNFVHFIHPYMNPLPCLEYFLRFEFNMDLFASPRIFKNWLNVSSVHKCLLKVYTTSIVLSMGPAQVWQQKYYKNVCHAVLTFCLTQGRPFHFFLVLLLLTLNILCKSYCECH